jgi:hypothetical protein
VVYHFDEGCESTSRFLGLFTILDLHQFLGQLGGFVSMKVLNLRIDFEDIKNET